MTFGRKELATLVAEFLGTGVLTLLVLSVQRSTIGVPFFVAVAAGLAVAVMSFAVAGISGGHFNPALTVANWTVRRISTVNAVLYIAVQLLAGFAVYHLYSYYVNSSLQSVGGHFTWRIMTAEAVGTGIFAFAWASASYQRFTSGLSASVAGLAYTVGIIAASSAAIGLLNPAVALGVKSWVWGTYVLGPVVGALVGVNLYNYLFAVDGVAVVASNASTTSAATTTTAKKPATRRKKNTRSKK